MIKISALNEESNDESEEEDVPTITKEAQEQIALTEYNRALGLLKEDEQEEALNIFKDLLETELLDEVEKPEIRDGRSRPMLSLKYSCFKNIAAIQAACENYDDAIENYWEAANLDDSDVTLWYRIGTLAMKIFNLELACLSFKQGLKCNPYHWPCLDNIITVLYAIPDYMNCLLYISMAFERDVNYIKGLAFRDRIFKDIPYFEECYKLYNSDWELDPPLYIEYDRILGDKLLAEAKEVSEGWAKTCKKEFLFKPLPDLSLKKPINKHTWLELGEKLLDMHRYIYENDLNFVSRIILTVVNPDDEIVITDEKNDMKMSDKMEFSELPNRDIEETNERCNNDAKSSKETEVDSSEPKGKKDVDILMEIETEEDRKSSSTDVQIIEDEDPLRLSDNEMLFEDSDQSKNIERSTSKVEDCENMEIISTEKEIFKPVNGIPMEKSSDKESDKSDDKIDRKTSEKTNENMTKIDEKSCGRTEGKEDRQKVKKRRRSALCFLQQWAWSCSSMRRSARVRGSNRREAERDDVLLEETLRRIFPSTLLPDTVKLTKEDPSKNLDDSMDTMDLYQLFANQENDTNIAGEMKSSDSSKSPSPDSCNQKYFGTELEYADVDAFINEYSGKANLMIIIAKFTEFLCTKWNQKWPKGLTVVYLQAYSYTREHIAHSSPFDEDLCENRIIKLDVEMTLLFGELHTDRWLQNKPDAFPSSSINKFGTGLPSEELGYIILSSAREDLLDENNDTLLLRILWFKVNIFWCQGDTDIVIETLELLLERFRKLESCNKKIEITLPNCECNSQISIKVVEKKLTSIQRSQKLGGVQRLYSDRKYAELSIILQDTFKFGKQRHNPYLSGQEHIIDRVEQLSMLLDSLWQLQRYEECYVWAEICLNEAWQNYLNALEDVQQKKWVASVVNALQKLEDCTNEVSAFVVKYLSESHLTRLVQNLVHIVCHQLDVSETAVEMPLETVLPWILLHYILQYEEDKERAKNETSMKNKTNSSANSESDDEDEGIPPSIMILFTAHEFLGRHSWCCLNEAKLLFFIMELIIPKLQTPQYSIIRNRVAKYLEQIFYCLYGHPNRVNKTRPKYLDDHGVPQMKLTWEGAQLLFDFYKPKQIPLFDSPRPISISTDTEILFKRIITLIPEDCDPAPLVEEMTNYILGKKEKIPTVKKTLPNPVSLVYYLLGDFYFKNSKWKNAIQYYTQDVCIHSDSLNSWAGIAMASGTIIETWLNGYKCISEDKFLAKAKLAQSSYQHAIDLAPNNIVIWTEYGSFVYMVHSFCSRLLKQETDTLSIERFEILETRKEEMLDIAANCFESANNIFIACQGIDDITKIDNERWLYYYMLGKVAEKKNQDPTVFLEFYARASDLLYENHAQYPRKISHKSPQNLAIEALEVYYRIHASILKYLEQHEGKQLKKSLGTSFQWHLKNCSEGHFTKYQPKINFSKKEFNSETNIKSTTGSLRPNNEEDTTHLNQPVDNDKSTENSKQESRKRCLPRDEVAHGDEKRAKLCSTSHLQLIQDVLGLTDNLIIRVCDIEDSKIKLCEEIIVSSSDDESKYQNTENVLNTSVQEIPSVQKSDTNENNLLKACAEKVRLIDNGDNMQEIMDQLMEEAMKISQANHQSLLDDEESNKYDRKWLQNEDVKTTEKGTKDTETDQKMQAPNKDDFILTRRDSQESTTTTQTTTTSETNNSSSTSSDESSSSEDTSDSDSSSESDSESTESNVEKKKPDPEYVEKEEYMSEEEVNALIQYCLAGLEQCILRFNEHHKSFYRLSHFYINNKAARNISRCKDLLLGSYDCQFYPRETFQGLFADRKSTNFFSGVWHIPNREIDRAGSFASHMSRCVTLLMEVLKEANDSRMLMQLCVQLAKTPEPDKKYLRDSEREQLSRQASALCLQSLRRRMQSMGPPDATETAQTHKMDPRTQVLVDCYKMYRQVQGHRDFLGKSTVQAMESLLIEIHKKYIGDTVVEGNVLETAIRCCQRQIMNSKIAKTNETSNNIGPTPVTPIPTIVNPTPIVTMPSTPPIRKPCKPISSSGRPRGRPPNMNKYLQGMPSNNNLMNQFNMKNHPYNAYMGGHTNPGLLNPYFINPLVDPNMLSALLSSGLSGNMMDSFSAMTYLNQLGNYQDILRQYQNNISSLTNMTACMSNTTTVTSSTISGTPTTSYSNINQNDCNNLNDLTIQQWLNMGGNSVGTGPRSVMYPSVPMTTPTIPVTTSTPSVLAKDRPNISITPVTHNTHKIKAHKSISGMECQEQKTLQQTSQVSKSIVYPSTTQVSLLKSSSLQIKSVPLKPVTAPLLRVSKSLTEPQPAHNNPPSSSLKSNGSGISVTPATVSHIAHGTMNSSLTVKPLQMNIPNITSQSFGTSLQHKLLLKKTPQQSQSLANFPKFVKKSKPLKETSIKNNSHSNLIPKVSSNIPQKPFLASDLSGVSVNPVSQTLITPTNRLPNYKKSTIKHKPMDNPTAFSQPNSVESMLSQLKQHSHLEIIPQQKIQKQSIPTQKNENSIPTDPITIQDVSRGKSGNVSSKKTEVTSNDSVEIITLDD